VTCDQVRPRLADYAVGALRGRERARLLNHVGACASCGAELEALERTGALVSRLSLESAPTGAWEAICHRIRDEGGGSARRGWGRALAMAGVALAVLIVALITFLPTLQRESGSPVMPQADEDIQLTMEAHLAAVWSAPLADAAAVGLHLGSVEDDS